MRAHYGQDFVEVRPQGRAGDGGNDGYLPADGHYYQVYGPVDPADKVTAAAKKLVDDFGKLKASWTQVTPMRAYSFVFNDKYEGTFAEIALALAAIEKGNSPVQCRPMVAAHLEDLFLSLPHEKMQDVLDTILPTGTPTARLDFAALREVIEHIMNSPASAVDTRFGELPTVDLKIQLNNLNACWADVLRHGVRQAGLIDRYHSRNSTFRRQELKEHLVEQYRKARDHVRAVPAIAPELSREDVVFAAFRESVLPKGATVATANALDTLIGYYFEACDIFDPYAEKDSPNASP